MLRPSRIGELETKTLVKEGTQFLLVLFLVSAGAYFFLSPFEVHLQTLEANHVRGMLERVGVFSRDAELPYRFFVNEKQIEISSLCSGLLEIVLLIGAIVATRNASWKKRMIGIALGVAALYVFNLLRIVATILQLVHTSIGFAEFTHDVLFRVVLILGFAGVYGIWLHGKWTHFLLHDSTESPIQRK